MNDAFNTLLPIATLLIGAGWANLLKRSELRNAMRLEASDQLAELPVRLWTKGGTDDLVDLNMALDRLIIRLDLAGVPGELSSRVKETARAFWHTVEPREGPDHDVAVDSRRHDDWTVIAALVGNYLGTRNPFRRRAIVRFARKWEELGGRQGVWPSEKS